MKVVKCPICKSENIEVLKGYAHAVEYHCGNYKCRKVFTKEYK